MMSQEQNDLITRTGPKDPCGKLMRMYWQPAALLDELQGPRPVLHNEAQAFGLRSAVR